MKTKSGLWEIRSRNWGRAAFFLAMALLNLGISLLTSLLGSLYMPGTFNTRIFEGWSLPAIFLVVVIAGPFLETLCYQYALIEGTLYYSGKNRRGIFLAIAVSALAFGISHLYNTVYMLAAMCMGVSLAYTYVRFRARSDISPFLGVYAIHAGINLVAFVINDLT